MVYAHMNLTDWAQDELLTALELEPDNPYIIFAYATFLNQLNDFEGADTYYKRTLENYPDSADYRAYYALNLMSLGKVDEAVEEFVKVLQIEPEHVESRFELAKIYFSQKKYETAKALLLDVLNTPNNAEIINLYAQIELRLKNYDIACALFEKLCELYPKNHLLLTDCAKCCLKTGKTKEAKDFAKRALEIFSDFSDALKILEEIQGGQNEQ